ncbi:MAG: hypothetical protein WDO71_15700 [Bacteroidota bacterium]
MQLATPSLPGRNILAVSFLFVSLQLSVIVHAQEFEVPASLPVTKEEFVNTEKDVIAAAKWLESNAIGTDMNKRTKVNTWVLAWLTNSPNVTIEVQQPIMKLFDKNPQLLMVWMAGYARYCLENSYSKDNIKCNVAGIKSAIACYNLGGDIKKEKLLPKVIDKDKEGKLEEWVKEALESK